jgi:hypothetical protein
VRLGGEVTTVDVIVVCRLPIGGGGRNDDIDVFDQETEQEAASGDVDQAFDVSGGGDNSNQCVGIQGVANTGNAQNQIGVIDVGNFGNFDGNNDFNGNDFCDGFDRDGFCDYFFDHFNDGFGNFEFKDVGASMELSPTNMTTSDQVVNQAASAFGK